MFGNQKKVTSRLDKNITERMTWPAKVKMVSSVNSHHYINSETLYICSGHELIGNPGRPFGVY